MLKCSYYPRRKECANLRQNTYLMSVKCSEKHTIFFQDGCKCFRILDSGCLKKAEKRVDQRNYLQDVMKCTEIRVLCLWGKLLPLQAETVTFAEQ